MNRRDFLHRASWMFGLALAGSAFGGQLTRNPRFAGHPFRMGVASGDPAPDGFVLWTRLAPNPVEGGGMPGGIGNVEVRWRVASDEGMRNVVASGTAVASEALAHSVHVETRGLEPGRWYWYQFHAGGEDSPVGRTRTAEAAGAGLDRLRFAFASCQHYEQGYYTAYRHMLEEPLDLVVHLGDYIYEGGPRTGLPRRHNSPEIVTLADYRNRYGLYKSDPDLMAAHAAFPWLVTWDDHEVDNNYAGAISEEAGVAKEAFLGRRAAAYQAYYENMPLRAAAMPEGPDMRLYRRAPFGSLAMFWVLDTRQFRSDQPCGDGSKPVCPEMFNPKATLLGDAQEEWLLSGLGQSGARWNVLAQQVMMMPMNYGEGEGEEVYSMDQWSGYPAARERFTRFLAERKPSNPVVLTGDIHANWAAEVKADFRNPDSATVAPEFVGTSITSGGDGEDTRERVTKQLPKNPHIRFFNAQRGYVSCEITPERWQSAYRVMEGVTRPGLDISTRAKFVVESGDPRIRPA